MKVVGLVLYLTFYVVCIEFIIEVDIYTIVQLIFL